MSRYVAAYRTGAIALPKGGLSTPFARPVSTPSPVYKQYEPGITRGYPPAPANANLPVGMPRLPTIPKWLVSYGRASPYITAAIVGYALYQWYNQANSPSIFSMRGWRWACGGPGMGPYGFSANCGQICRVPSSIGPAAPFPGQTSLPYTSAWLPISVTQLESTCVGVLNPDNAVPLAQRVPTPRWIPNPNAVGDPLPAPAPAPSTAPRPSIFPEWVQPIDPFQLPIGVPMPLPLPIPYPLIPNRPWYDPDRSPWEQPIRGPQPRPVPRPSPNPGEWRDPWRSPRDRPRPEREPRPGTDPIEFPDPFVEESVPGQPGVTTETDGRTRSETNPRPSTNPFGEPYPSALPSPARRKEKEVKTKWSTSGRVVRIGGGVTEVLDGVESIWDALPDKLIKRYRPRYWYKEDGKWKSRVPRNAYGKPITHPRPQDMLKQIYKHADSIDWTKAANNYLKNFLEDMFYGKTSRKVSQTFSRSGYSRRPFGPFTGPGM